ncbi:MAG: hypothetical protein V1753_01860 [Pseudomonadota bacterium]
MEFIFICSETGKAFNSKNFEITENYGIKTDEKGNKTLDAKVVLNDPCPFCGKRHEYHASKLSCPFAD